MGKKNKKVWPGPKPGPCSRSLAEQWEDKSGAIRKIDHPRSEVGRLDLATIDRLDGFRRDHPGVAEAAMDAHEELLHALDAKAEVLARLDEAALEASSPIGKPTLVTVVCAKCGVFAHVTDKVAWSVVRAMKATGWTERDVLLAYAVIEESWEDQDPPWVATLFGAGSDGDEDAERVRPEPDQLTPKQYAELLPLYAQDFDDAEIRKRYGIQPPAPRRAR